MMGDVICGILPTKEVHPRLSLYGGSFVSCVCSWSQFPDLLEVELILQDLKAALINHIVRHSGRVQDAQANKDTQRSGHSKSLEITHQGLRAKARPPSGPG